MLRWIRVVPIAACLAVSASFAQSQEMLSPGGMSPNYYPGVADGVPAYAHDAWWQWAHARTIVIHTLWNRLQAAKQNGDSPGCIGRSVEDCIVTLAQDMPVADDYKLPSFADPAQMDVNGKRITPKFLELTVFRAGDSQNLTSSYLQERHPLFLFLSDANVVTEMDIGEETMSILRARTEAEYDGTMVYEILRPELRAGCPQLGKLELYQFIENKLKPPVRNAAQIGANAKARINVVSSGFLSFCGRKLRVDVRTERPRYHPHQLVLGPVLAIR